ncbi:hypothetical protein MMC12_002786 [Toensbergia leucococca]|nr:hypothetical protein [Toensbergia leucococca]
MTEILRHPASPSKTQAPNVKALVQSLDDLLERYLNLLDQYQKLQHDLSHCLSSGYLSLAQANFTSPYRIRYGQDYYDDRMQASTTVSINPSGPTFSITRPSESPNSQSSKKDSSDSPSSPSLGPLIPEKDGTEKKAKARDPLHWFGILVPPALRSTQKEFKNAVLTIIPALANIVQEMMELEVEIKRMREEIGRADQ